jgi:murein DD-endopeptidase MepM/ murein hydrolase activator NlpD
MPRLPARWLALAATLALASTAGAAPSSYNPPGQLVSGSGSGRADSTVYAPGIRFPIEAAPAFANSQVWGHGGLNGPGGGQCDTENFSYPWSDNYCETRSYSMPLCPTSTGHQGQDVRAATCDKNLHWVVAVTDGTITNIGSYSVYLTAADGTRFDYLHMGSLQVAVGARVTRGSRIGKVSNEFGGEATTVHLHVNIRQDIAGVGNVYVPPYLSLIRAYEQLLGGTGGTGAGGTGSGGAGGVSTGGAAGSGVGGTGVGGAGASGSGVGGSGTGGSGVGGVGGSSGAGLGGASGAGVGGDSSGVGGGASGSGPGFGGGAGAPNGCAPGRAIPCPCPGGGEGVHVCSEDGTKLSACLGCAAPAAEPSNEAGCACSVVVSERGAPASGWLLGALGAVLIATRRRGKSLGARSA